MENPNNPNIAPAPSVDSKLHFLDYWRIIRIRKTVIFAVFLLVVLTTTIVTYWLPRYYSSTVRIAVDKDTPDIATLFEYRQTPAAYDPYFIQTEYERIQSKTVLWDVIGQLRLSEKWGAKYGIGTLMTNQSYTILKKRLDVRQYRNTSLIEIRVLDEDNGEAADIANQIAKVYREVRNKTRKDNAQKGIEALEKALAAQEAKVNELSTNVAEMLRTNHISDAYAESGQFAFLEPETVRRLEGERISAQGLYIQTKSMVDYLTNLQPAQLRQTLPTASADTLLNELLSRYATAEQELTSLKKEQKEENPNIQKVQALLDKIDTQITNRVNGIMVGLNARAEGLKADFQAREAELEKAKKKDEDRAKIYIPYTLAKRELESQKQVLQTMRLRIVQEQTDLNIPKSTMVEVIDPAEPGERPVRPNIPINIALGIIVGLVVGIGLAFFIEYLDTSVKTIDDVERSLQAPVLGVIPQNVGYLIEEGPESPHAEAYRVLRTNLLFSRKDDRLNTLTVVSGGAGEGKSTTVFNLATVFAQNGQRVLVVDSDLRRPSLHKFLRVSNAQGLTNYLLKQAALEEVIQTTSLPTLDFLPSGKLPSSSLGILNSTRMKEFINDVKQRYDMVFFDSPPIMGVSDASILASEVDMTLLVVQYRKYPQIMTLRAKQMVEKVGGNLMGIVLNNINISQDSYYYYYSGYYYDYYSKRDQESESKPEDNGQKPAEAVARLDLKQKF